MKKLVSALALVVSTTLLSACYPTFMPVPPGVTVFEDGSGRGQDGTVYDEGTFAWDCATMGNKVCG